MSNKLSYWWNGITTNLNIYHSHAVPPKTPLSVNRRKRAFNGFSFFARAIVGWSLTWLHIYTSDKVVFKRSTYRHEKYELLEYKYSWNIVGVGINIVGVVGIYKMTGFETPGGGVLPYKGLTGMCRWMGSPFHNRIDYNGVTFSIELLEWGRTFSDFLGVRQFFIFTVSNRPFPIALVKS